MKQVPRSLPAPLEQYRSYLNVVARVQLHPVARRRLEPSDIVQDTLLEAHRDRDRFHGESPGELLGWLRGILAHNLANALRDLRREKRDPARERSLDAAVAASEVRMASWISADRTGPGTAVEKAERQLLLAQDVEKLPEAQQEAIVMRYWQGLSLDEIAEQMERSAASVAGLLYRGLKELRGRWGTGEDS